MKTKKTIAVAGTLLLGASLLMGGCNSKTLNVKTTVYSQGDKDYTLEELVKDYQSVYGSTELQQSIAYKLVNENYKVTDKEVEKKYKSIAEDNGGESNLEDLIKENNMTVDGYKADIKDGLALDKALKDLNDVTEKKIKKRYLEVKNVRHAIEVAVSSKAGSKKLASVVKEVEGGSSKAALMKKYQNDEDVFINERDYTPDVEFDGLEGIEKLGIGDSKKVKTSEGTAVVRVESIDEQSYDDLKDKIEKELMHSTYKDLNDVYKKIIKDKGIKFNDDYKSLSVVNTTNE